MLSDYGFYLLCLCFISSIYGAVSALVALLFEDRRFLLSSTLAQVASTTLCLGAASLLVYLFYTRDYSVLYVYKNSSNDLPAFYTLSAFWSALEGSHFLWTLLLAVCSFAAHVSRPRENLSFFPYVAICLHSVLAWMFYLSLSHCDPFKLTFPVQSNGLGMNALLQNPYMALHPPSLFLGYSSSAITFAYSVAALCYGKLNQSWLNTVRAWALFSWIFLTTGIFLGGRWAYVELGWSGYWAWDPVENSSFLPWLFMTALLHALIVQERTRGELRRYVLVLAFFAFFSGFFGTFITRSGIISSVHSFAQSPIGPFYLLFLVGLALLSLLLYLVKARDLKPAGQSTPSLDQVEGAPALEIKKPLSKEGLMIFAQLLLASFAFIVFMGTMYPILSELVTGSRFNIQAPYFNAFAPYLGFSFIVALTFANLLHPRSSRLKGGMRLQVLAIVGALPLSALFAWLGGVGLSSGKAWILQSLGIFLCCWSSLCLFFDLFTRLAPSAERRITFAYLGSFLAHIGVITAILGFLGNYRGMETQVTLDAGDSTEFYGYRFEFMGMQIENQDNVELFTAPLKLSRDGRELGIIKPSRALYPTKNELYHEIGLKDGFWHDLYIVLSDFEKNNGQQVTIEIHINPTVKIVWISAFLMVIGAILSWFDRFKWARWNLRRMSSLNRSVIFCLLFLPLLAWSVSGIASNGEEATPGSHPIHIKAQDLPKDQYTLFREVSDQLRCPTCIGLSILQSEAPFSVQLRSSVVDEIKKGRTEQQILDHFTERYGLWILRKPPASGFHLLAWILPVCFFVVGGLLYWKVFFKKSRGEP